MPVAHTNGVELAYEVFGSDEGSPIMLVSGLGAQLVRWPRELIDGLIERNFRVVVFDNRDTGASTILSEAGVPDFERVGAGIEQAPYRLDDMAADVIGLLDHLDIAATHLVGVSMGGMIAQLVAADYPERVRSLTLIMSSTGNPELAPSDPAVFAQLNRPGPEPEDGLEPFVAWAIERERLIASPGFPPTDEDLRRRILSETERGHHPEARARQMAAIWSSGDRRPRLASIVAPTVVVHGKEDKLIPPDAGEDLAANIGGARLKLIAGMGHDLPAALAGEFCAAICSVTVGEGQ